MRIEGFDISNLGGEHTVASMVVFEGGAPRKSDYRRFRVRGDRSAGPDDFASMEEVLERRTARLLEQSDCSPHDAERDESFAAVPDLIVIDGGKGQLSAGMRALAAAGRAGDDRHRARQAARGGLRPGRSDPLEIQPDSEALRLLQRVRDEAHRFAIEHHRNRRDKAMTSSLLDELARRGAGAQAGAARALRLAGAARRREPRGDRGGARASPASSPATSTASSTRRAERSR